MAVPRAEGKPFLRPLAEISRGKQGKQEWLHNPLQGGNAGAHGSRGLLDYCERKCVPAHEPP